MQSFIQKGVAVLGIFVLMAVVAPTTAKAESYSWGSSWSLPVYTYQPQYTYQYGYQNQYLHLQYLLQLVEQLQKQLDAIKGNDDDDDGDSEIEITTLSATDIEEDEVRLRGEIDFNSSDDAFVWFEWGEDDDDLDEETPRIYRDDNDDEDFSARVTDLDEGEKYYFRAVGEDEDGNIDRGSIKSFRTDGDDNDSDDERPDVETGDADDITDDSVEIEGEVDMNDFRNGKVFFIYGEDEDQVEDVEDDYDTYSEIDEDGDDLQKVLADSDLDGSSSYRLDIDGLDDDREYFYSICVEYEDEDDDDVILCGSVESFETDN